MKLIAPRFTFEGKGYRVELSADGSTIVLTAETNTDPGDALQSLTTALIAAAEDVEKLAATVGIFQFGPGVEISSSPSRVRIPAGIPPAPKVRAPTLAIVPPGKNPDAKCKICHERMVEGDPGELDWELQTDSAECRQMARIRWRHALKKPQLSEDAGLVDRALEGVGPTQVERASADPGPKEAILDDGEEMPEVETAVDELEDE